MTLGAASHLLVHRIESCGVNMHDDLVVASDRLRELLTARWLPERVQNGSIHGGPLCADPYYVNCTGQRLFRQPDLSDA